jgi:hypothetical protein
MEFDHSFLIGWARGDVDDGYSAGTEKEWDEN